MKACSSSAEPAGEDAPGELGAPLDHQRDDPASRRARGSAACGIEPPLCGARRPAGPRPRARRGPARSSAGASTLQRTSVGTSTAVSTRRECGGRRSFVSNTTRIGLPPDASRTVSRGSSASAVPMPMATASWRARSAWTRARASGPVTHFEAPLRVAMRPSSDSASLSETYGSPSVTNFVHGAMSAARLRLADADRRPRSPPRAASRRRRPPRAGSGRGSR